MYKFNRGLASMYSAYIKNNRKAEGSTGSVIPLLLSPNSLSETLSANYDQQNIPGHRAPIISYSFTGARQVNMSFTVLADHVPAGYDMNSYIQALKDLEYPTYDASIVYAPSCTLVLPNLSIDGVCTSVTIDYKVERTLRNGTMSADVSLSFTEVKDTLNGYINIDLNTSSNSIAQTSSNGNGDKKTPEITQVDKLTIYGEGLSQSSPLEIQFTPSKPTGFIYDGGAQRDPKNALSKYMAYGNVYNIHATCECLTCGRGLGSSTPPENSISLMADHIKVFHNGKKCTFKLNYRGDLKYNTAGCSGGTRYIKGIHKSRR